MISPHSLQSKTGVHPLYGELTHLLTPVMRVRSDTFGNQAVGALGELFDKSDFSLHAWDSFSQEIRDLLLFYCQKSLNLLQMQ